MDELYKEKRNIQLEINELRKKITYKEHKVVLINDKIAKKCQEENNGHIIVYEREEGPYGEMVRYCKVCGYPYM